MDPQTHKRRPLKKWLTFAVRWGIAISGIALVLWNISFYDRVRVLDPVTNQIEKVRVLNNARDSDLQFTAAAPGGGEPKAYRRDEPWVRPARKSVAIRTASGHVRSVKLYAVKPIDVARSGRSVRQLLVEDPDSASGRGRIVTPAEIVGANDLTVSSPYVETGINRLVREADTKYLLAAIFIVPLSYLLTSARWHLLLESLDIRLSPFRTFVLN